MSCSHIINAYTNAKYLYRGVSRFRQSFTCGRCAGCISKHRTDWRVRSYFESWSCLKDGGYILFDTLTYTDSNIRHYSDIFPELSIPVMLDGFSFSRADVQKFFKRLRINLKRDGYKYTSCQLRYILTSEFGTKDGCTHRPHYHVLFFVKFDIDPIIFSRHVSKAWTFGKTDGVRPCDDCSLCPIRDYCKGVCLYQSPDYVTNERVVVHNNHANLVKCVNYVTKYISKDMYMTDKLQNSVDILWRVLFPDYQTNYLVYRQYRKFCAQVLPFHLQSQGFGLALIKDSSLGELDYIKRTNQVHLPTGEKDVVRSVALPRYYQLKLYYTFEKVDGRVRWYLTADGVNNKVNHLDDTISRYMRDYALFDKTISDSRLYDLALYKIVYSGTLTDYQSLLLPYKQYYRNMLQYHSESETPLYINRATKKDRLTIGAFLSTRYSVTDDGEIVYRGKQLHKEFRPFDGYVVVDDKVCKYWSGFDSRITAFERWRKGVANGRDVVQANYDASVDYYKALGLLT